MLSHVDSLGGVGGNATGLVGLYIHGSSYTTRTTGQHSSISFLLLTALLHLHPVFVLNCHSCVIDIARLALNESKSTDSRKLSDRLIPSPTAHHIPARATTNHLSLDAFIACASLFCLIILISDPLYFNSSQHYSSPPQGPPAKSEARSVGPAKLQPVPPPRRHWTELISAGSPRCVVRGDDQTPQSTSQIISPNHSHLATRALCHSRSPLRLRMS